MKPAVVIVFALLISACSMPILVGTPIVFMVPIMPVASSCETGGFPPPTAGSGPVTIPAGFNGGTLVGESAHIQAPIQLVEGGSNLLISVKDDLIVSADILFPANMQQRNSPSLNITLVSLEGKVRIDPDVKVGDGTAATGTAGNRNVASGIGIDGGEVKLIGLNIEIEGQIYGNDGGTGGEMIVVGGGNIFTSAANGGRGGNVVLCAMDTITAETPQGAQNNAGVESGGGGIGGKVDINVPGNVAMNANGTAGNGGNSGDIHLIGTDQGGAPVQISNEAVFMGSWGGKGGFAFVDAGIFSAIRTGQPAEGKGGSGGNGGTVLFLQSVHAVGLGRYEAGIGGDGEKGEAFGNGGRHATLRVASGAGGNAIAVGGKGGQKGTPVVIPLPNNQTRPGTPGTHGSGGNAFSRSGEGGDGLFVFLQIRAASPSGKATAIGGPNGRGQGAGAPVIAGPNPPLPRAVGGRMADAFQWGRP